MSKPFHQSKPWEKLAKAHKQLVCVDCGATTDIQSGHILAASRFKMSRLWMINLKLQCKSCNLKQGTKLQFNLLTLKLLMVYGMIKGIYWLTIILYFSLTTAVMVMDISTGGFDTSFTGQILIEVWEAIPPLP